MLNDFPLEAVFTTTNEEVPDIMFSMESLKKVYFESINSINGQNISFYAVDPDTAVDYFTNLDLEAEHTYKDLRAGFMANKVLESIGFILFAGVFLGAAAIASSFILRSSLLSRIYEISVYRALGTPKRDLRKIFLLEALLLTMFTSLWGYLLTSYLLVRLQEMSSGFFVMVKITPLSFVIGLVIIFGVNILSGIIPVSSLLRRTPAEIISKYDF